MKIKNLLDITDVRDSKKVLVQKNGEEYVGKVMPSSDDDHIVLKLDSGYNIGIKTKGAEVKSIQDRNGSQTGMEKISTDFEKKYDPEKPDISIISTGGTIASRVDYRTGAVSSQFDADDIVSTIPELEDIANYSGKMVSNLLSENVSPDHWVKISKAVYNEIEKGADGIIIAHGTDTLSYTASALSFILETPVPIALVGSQRSADRPSSDNVLNVVSAANYAVSDIAEVAVIMHAETSDSFCYAHRGTKVRKMHTSRRGAFRSIDDLPLAKIEDGSVISINKNYSTRGEKKANLQAELDKKCTILKFTPGMSPEVLQNLASTHNGIVIEGTGLGHVSSDWIPVIKNIIESGVPIVMTSQCLYGRVCNRVYETGRDLIEAGVIQGEDMLPETALVKLMWALKKTNNIEELRKIMKTNISGEICKRSKENTFLI